MGQTIKTLDPFFILSDSMPLVCDAEFLLNSGCFHVCSLVHLVQISGWVVTHLHFPFGSVWFPIGKISSEPKCISKSYVGAVIPFIGQKSRQSDPLSFSHWLNILNIMCFCSASWAIRSSAQISRRQRVLLLLWVNPPFVFVYKVVSAHNVQRS